MTSRSLTALGLLLVSALACDKATPVAPDGTSLTVSANPTQIGLTGTSTITVVGRKPDGQPLNPGTEVRFSVDIGSISPAIATIENGQATATYTADGRKGAAKVTVKTGTGSVSADTTVQVGAADGTKPVLLVSANPSNVAVGGTSSITVIARNSDGSSVGANREIILTSTLGVLHPTRPTTAADGTASSTLNVGTQAGSATVSAILGSSDAATTTVTIRDAATAISLQTRPSSIQRAGATVELTAFVTNGQGQPLQGAPVTFQADRGSLETTGVVFTDTTGVATNRLVLTQSDLPSSVTAVTVRASTPSGTGTLLTDTATIAVQ
jgi:adhesin/invasin